MNILALEGSPRKSGNSSLILEKFLAGAEKSGSCTKLRRISDLNIEECTGCLRCNLIKRCSLRDEEWNNLSSEILDSNVLVFATPVYFHHFPSGMKKVLDRFRSFFHVKITGDGLIHTPWHKWSKDIVLIAAMGSPDKSEAKPLVDLLNYMKNILGENNRIHFLFGTRLAVSKQIIMSEEELKTLYGKIDLPIELSVSDFQKNRKLLNDSFELGKRLGG